MKKLFNKLCRILSGIDADEAMPSETSPAAVLEPEPPAASQGNQATGQRPRLEVGKEYFTRDRYNRVRITRRLDRTRPSDSPYVFEGAELKDDGTMVRSRRTYTAEGRFMVSRNDSVLDLWEEATSPWPTSVVVPAEPPADPSILRLQAGHAYEDLLGRTYVCCEFKTTTVSYPASLLMVDSRNHHRTDIAIPFTADGKYWVMRNSPSDHDIQREIPMNQACRDRLIETGHGTLIGHHGPPVPRDPPMLSLRSFRPGQRWRNGNGSPVRIDRIDDETWRQYPVCCTMLETGRSESYTAEGYCIAGQAGNRENLVELVADVGTPGGDPQPQRPANADRADAARMLMMNSLIAGIGGMRDADRTETPPPAPPPTITITAIEL